MGKLKDNISFTYSKLNLSHSLMNQHSITEQIPAKQEFLQMNSASSNIFK